MNVQSVWMSYYPKDITKIDRCAAEKAFTSIV